jgi:5-formyltetrahydrofolate cyclo-ligase
MHTLDKRALRKTYRARRDALPNREQRSAAICARITTLLIYQRAEVIHCFLPIRSEVDTLPLLTHAFAQHKRVVVPVVRPGTTELAHSWLRSLDTAEVEPGIFGTLQPRALHHADPGDWDVVIVPLLAFDRQGYRLGYGKGYYDRLLTAAPTPTVGAAFAAQEAPHVPHEPHDIPLTWVVTEEEAIATGSTEQPDLSRL